MIEGPTLRWPLRALPPVVRAGRFPLDDQGFEHRYRAPTHALHIYDYHGEIRMGGRRFVLRPGDATLSPAGGETLYHLPAPGHHWCIHFQPVGRHGERAVLPFHLPLGGLRRRLVDGIGRITALMATPAGRDQAIARAGASAALQELLLAVAALAACGGTPVRAPRSAQAVERAAAHLDQRFSEPLDVPTLARSVRLTQNYLAHRFRAHYGMTLQRYLLARRIEHA